MEEVNKIYEAFAAFGSARGKAQGSVGDISAIMDGQKFAKFCKDCGVVKDPISLTDVDIIFNKVKAKTARKITCEQFYEAIGLLAVIRYKKLAKEEAAKKMIEDIVKSGGTPKLGAGTTFTSKDDITKRLTDTSQYTGNYH